MTEPATNRTAHRAATGGDYVCIADQVVANGWIALDDVANVYYQEWTAATDLVAGDVTDDVVVFEEFQINGDTDNDTIKQNASKEIVVTAYAVQADGFDTAEDAWAATFGK